MQSIYGLTDPWDELVHYVGRAQDVFKRYAQHLNTPHKNAEKNDWMASVKGRGRVPGLIVIEQDIEDNLAPSREMYWIAYYTEAGAPLTNIVLPRERLNLGKQETSYPKTHKNNPEISLDDLEQALSTYPNDRLLTVVGLASLIKTSPAHICVLLSRRELTGFKVGKRWRFEEKDLQSYIEQQRQKVEQPTALCSH